MRSHHSPPPIARPPRLSSPIFYDSHAARATLVFSALSQVPIAFSDVFAGRALHGLSQGQLVARDVVALVGCHSLPVVFEALNSIQAASWRSQASARIVDGITRHMYGQTARWVQGRPRADEHSHRLANDVPWVLGMLTGFAPQRAQAMGALAVQAAMMGLLLEPMVATSLLAALAAAYVCSQLSERADVKESDRSKRQSVPYSDPSSAMVERQATSGTLPLDGEDPHLLFGRIRNRYWDNVTLGNALNYKTWRSEFDGIHDLFVDDLVRRERRRADFSALSGLLSGIAVGGALTWYAHALYSRGEQEKLVTTFFPLLARTASIVGQSQDLMDNNQELNRHLRIFARLLDETQAASTLNVFDQVSPDLHIADAKGNLYSPSDLLRYPPSHGRLTIRDYNGRGKSMFAAAFKQAHGERAWLIPARHGLLFDVRGGSSGQTAMAHLAAIQQDLSAYSSVRMVVLDEWDANLDSNNRRVASRWLDDMAKTHLIIEITHSPISEPQDKADA